MFPLTIIWVSCSYCAYLHRPYRPAKEKTTKILFRSLQVVSLKIAITSQIHLQYPSFYYNIYPLNKERDDAYLV